MIYIRQNKAKVTLCTKKGKTELTLGNSKKAKIFISKIMKKEEGLFTKVGAGYQYHIFNCTEFLKPTMMHSEEGLNIYRFIAKKFPYEPIDIMVQGFTLVDFIEMHSELCEDFS